MPHEHQWGSGYREVDVPGIDGVATMPDGRTIQSTANTVRYPEPIDDFVCGVCGATRDTPAEHPQTAEGRQLAEIVWPQFFDGKRDDDEVQRFCVELAEEAIETTKDLPHWRLAAIAAFLIDEGNYEGGKWGDYGQVVVDASALWQVLTGRDRRFEMTPDYAGTLRESQQVAWNLEERLRELEAPR